MCSFNDESASLRRSHDIRMIDVAARVMTSATTDQVWREFQTYIYMGFWGRWLRIWSQIFKIQNSGFNMADKI